MGDERATLSFIPCLWCAGPIPCERTLEATQACALPLYCGDGCRSDLERSLVKRIYDASEAAAEKAGFADFGEFETAVRSNFAARLRSATSPDGPVGPGVRRTINALTMTPVDRSATPKRGITSRAPRAIPRRP